MKKISRQNKILALFVLFLILVFFLAPVRQAVSRSLMAVFRPVFNLNKSNTNDNSLINNLVCGSLQKENEELKTLLSQAPKDKQYILGSIISRPPQSPYDILIIDAGSDNGVGEGMMATVSGNVLLGRVIEVLPQTSKIKLISFPGEENNVLLKSGDKQISAIAIGQGGENLEIKLPNSLEIKSGDQITTMGVYPLVIGTVGKIEVNQSDPFQKILFRLPVNIQELNYIMIEKND